MFLYLNYIFKNHIMGDEVQTEVQKKFENRWVSYM